MCFTAVPSSAISKYCKDLGNSRYCSYTVLDVSSRSDLWLFVRDSTDYECCRYTYNLLAQATAAST